MILTYPTVPVPNYNYILTPKYQTLVSTMTSAKEIRRFEVRFPKRSIQLNYRYKTIAERNLLHQFFTQCRGRAYPFWYLDLEDDATSFEWYDEYVGRGGPLNLLGAIADDGGTQTDETIACKNETTKGMTLLPASPALNDAYYFGSLTQFDKLTLTIGQQGAPAYVNGVSGWEITWEYWNGTAWVALTGVTDNTIGFTAAPGDHDVTFDVLIDWAITLIDGIDAYWIRARVSDFETCTTQPLGNGALVNSKIYDLHGVGVDDETIYIDETAKTGGGVDYTLVLGGGAAGVDRILFGAYPAVGALITSDFTGQLRIKARFDSDSLGQTVEAGKLIDIEQITLQEIQW
jgi:hypothetical protein